MSDSHTTGKYTIIAALITGILSIIATVLPTYLSKPGPSSPNNPTQTTVPTSQKDEPPLTAVHSPPVHSPVSPNNENILATKEISRSIDPVETEIAQVEKPKNVKPPESKNTVPTNTEKKKIKRNQPTKKAINLFNKNFTGNLAIVDLENEDGISLLLDELLSENKHQVTTSFFQSDFNEKYKNSFWEKSTELIDEFKLPNTLNCICIIKEKITYQEKERFNEPFSVAKGNVTIKILNTDNSSAKTVRITAGGSGADEARAYVSFQENFITQLKSKNHLQKFESCKN